jgi:ABC-type glycerol-3-phosphate transport system substrate-binding protein
MRFLSVLFLLMTLGQAAIAEPTCAPAKGAQPVGEATTPRPLRVVLYPFIPGFDSFKNEVKARFEQAHPDIKLEIVDLTDNY